MKQETCSCSAYDFPHRLGGGKCLGNELAPYCGDCNQPCDVKKCDSGMGHYEFWGSTGYDTHPYLGSSCCGANVFQDCALTEPYNIPQGEY